MILSSFIQQMTFDLQVHEVEERSGVQLKLIEVNEDDVLKRLTEVTKKRIEARTVETETRTCFRGSLSCYCPGPYHMM